MSMAVKTAFAAGALAVTLSSSVWAQSPRLVPAGAVLPPYEIVTSVRSAGLDPSTRPVLRGRVYVLRAYDATQFEKRVVVDARSGEVLSVRDAFVAAAPGYTPYDPRYGHYEPPRPPGAVARAVPPDAEPILDEPLFPRAQRAAPGREPADQKASASANAQPAPKARPAASTFSKDIAGAAANSKDVATISPQPSNTAALTPAPMPSAAELAAAAAAPGKSVPAPSASRAAEATQKEAADKTATQFVPVAPLE
jgi:hypothetical protein